MTPSYICSIISPARNNEYKILCRRVPHDHNHHQAGRAQGPAEYGKISEAIYKAFQVTGGKSKEEAIELANEVVGYMDHVLHLTEPSVEQIQDVVEKVLMENGHARTAKEYILYRAERTRVREMNTRLMKIYEDLTFKSRDNDLKRENANIDGDTAMGTMLKYGSEGAKQFYEMYVLDPEHAKAHREGDIHIHDLDFLTLTTTCCQIDIDKLFTAASPPATAICGSPTTFPAIRRWPVSPSSPTRTTSTAARASRTSTTAWPRAWLRPTGASTDRTWPGPLKCSPMWKAASRWRRSFWRR